MALHNEGLARPARCTTWGPTVLRPIVSLAALVTREHTCAQAISTSTESTTPSPLTSLHISKRATPLGEVCLVLGHGP